MEFILIIGVALLAGALQAAVGFGFGLLAVSLISLAFGIKTASVILVLGGLSLNVFVFYRLRAHFRFERITPFLVATAIGVPLGVLFLVHADAYFLKKALGALLIFSGLQRSIPHLARHRWHPLALGLPCGLFAGALAGAFGTGGPPAVAYVASQQFDKYRWVATMQAIFGLSALIRLGTLGVSGVLTPRLLWLSAAGALGAVLGARGGLHLLRHLPPNVLKWAVTGLLFILGGQFILL